MMKILGIVSTAPKPKTSNPAKRNKTYLYLLKGVVINRSNQVWTADITYVPMEKGFGYLVAIMDWHARKVLSWCLSNTLDADFVSKLWKLLSRTTVARRYLTPIKALNLPQKHGFVS